MVEKKQHGVAFNCRKPKCLDVPKVTIVNSVNVTM